MTAKPTVSELGIDLTAQVWHRSGHGDGSIEVAFVRAAGEPAEAAAGPAEAAAGPAEAAAGPAEAAAGPAEAADGPAADGGGSATQPAADRVAWILMRVAGDPGQQVLVFDRHEWECFLDGARNGEFDDAARP